MSYQNILEYLKHTPHNTNLAIVKNMLENNNNEQSSDNENVFLITMTSYTSGDEENSFTIDKTMNELLEAKNNNKMIILNDEIGQGSPDYPLLTKMNFSNSQFIGYDSSGHVYYIYEQGGRLIGQVD